MRKRGVLVAKVLIVDDDHTTVQLLKTLLELDGFDVAIARSGGEVEAVAVAEQPDIFLMDYHLSDMDGVDILRELRAGGPFANTPVVMTSGLDVEEEVMEAGANAFLVKPFEPDDLPLLLNNLIG
jgi:DNA-binding response OmpR family regulator